MSALFFAGAVNMTPLGIMGLNLETIFHEANAGISALSCCKSRNSDTLNWISGFSTSRVTSMSWIPMTT